MKALIDADIICYLYSQVNEDTIKWSDDENEPETIKTDYTRATEGILKFVSDLVEDLEVSVESITMCLSCPSKEGFRRRLIDPHYKSNRDNIKKPLLLKDLRNFVKENYLYKEIKYLEADDIMGIMQTKDPRDEYLICSIDKDMSTIPGYLYNWNKKDLGIQLITEPIADYNFYTQILIGDTCDGYSGCPGIGPKRSKDILNNLASIRRRDLNWIKHEYVWKGIVNEFEKKGLDEEEALKQARLSRILRAEDYNFEKKEVILWTPKTKKRTY